MIDATGPRRGYADISTGQVHYMACGRGRPLVLLHQTPRSHHEFDRLAPLLAGSFSVIAPDMPGFGASTMFPAPHTIEAYAAGVVEMLDSLGVGSFGLLGHHTGGQVAVEIAARVPDRVEGLVLSSTSLSDADHRTRYAEPPVDVCEPSLDGSHLLELWNQRRPWYPEGHELLDRFLYDAMSPGMDPAEGHRACSRYVMEDRVGLVRSPVFLLGAEVDRFAMPELPRLEKALTEVTSIRTAVVAGGGIPVMETHAEEVADLLRGFFDTVAASGRRA